MDSRSVELVGNLIRASSSHLVLIMGPGAVGKSHFALQIAAYLMEDGSTANVVELDGFLFDRAIRMKDGWVTAHDPAGFDIQRINNVLDKLINERVPQEVSILDKSVSKVVGEKTLTPSHYTVVEGTISFYLEAVHYADLRIYITAAKAVQFSNRHRRESLEVGYTEDVSKRRFADYWRDYLLFIRPKRRMADVKMIVDGNYVAKTACRKQLGLPLIEKP